MSSENLHNPDSAGYLWSLDHGDSDHVMATYLIGTPIAGEQAAVGLAREQSICATLIGDFELPEDIDSYCARVVEVEELEGAAPHIAPMYFLNTPVYPDDAPSQVLRQFRIVIAYPAKLFGSRLTRLWNSIFGEVHRLGFLSSVRLEKLTLPAALARNFRGPLHGVAGLRGKLDVYDRPLFCRSMRPASGLTNETMVAINEQVLMGGFDIIKDDELTYDSPRAPFAERVRRMLEMKRKVEDRTGERKLYFANIIDDLPASLAMAEQAQSLGADGILLSIAAQGISMIEEVRRRTDLAILSHNSCGDALTRAGCWGASDAVVSSLQRLAGADLVVSPGPFATRYQDAGEAEAFLEACRGPLGDCAPVMPIIQGGKQPEHLPAYTRDVGSVDYMIIAATWLDNHPAGVRAGARAFRRAWERYEGLSDLA